MTFLVWQVFFWSLSAIKLAATYNALEGTDADFLARPTYKMTTKNYILFSTMEATVEGYKGKYTNFREVNTFERELEIAKKKGVLQQVKIKKNYNLNFSTPNFLLNDIYHLLRNYLLE